MIQDHNMPYQIQSGDRFAGFFLTIAILAILGGYHLLQSQKGGHELSPIRYTAQMNAAHGIIKGSAVRLAGLDIGEVKKVKLVFTPQKENQPPTPTIQIQFVLYQAYTHLFTEKSTMAVGGGPLASLMGDATLELTSGHAKTAWNPKKTITIIEPVTPEEILANLDLDQLSKDINEIVGNVETITGNVNTLSAELGHKGGALFATLNNVKMVTKDLSDTTKQLPSIINSASVDVKQVGKVLTQVDQLLASIKKDVSALVHHTRNSAEEVSQRIKDLSGPIESVHGILTDVQKGAHNIPALLSGLRDLIQNSEELTDKLKRHWLLGGTEAPPLPTVPAIHYDETLYNE
ncbi:MlaD family protein [Magnetococcales bacterium HHB-1]